MRAWGRVKYILDVSFGTHRGFVRMLLGEADYLLGRVNPFLLLEPKRIRRLVFVCQGNINRSAFAQAVANSLGANAISLGLATTTGGPAFARAIETAPSFGIDLTSHKATDIADYAFTEGDVLLAMEVRHARRLVHEFGFPQAPIILLGHWARPHRIHLHDPYTLSQEYFYSCFALIHTAVVRLVDELRAAESPGVLR